MPRARGEAVDVALKERDRNAQAAEREELIMASEESGGAIVNYLDIRPLTDR